jgi:hypothetical protein
VVLPAIPPVVPLFPDVATELEVNVWLAPWLWLALLPPVVPKVAEPIRKLPVHGAAFDTMFQLAGGVASKNAMRPFGMAISEPLLLYAKTTVTKGGLLFAVVENEPLIVWEWAIVI